MLSRSHHPLCPILQEGASRVTLHSTDAFASQVWTTWNPHYPDGTLSNDSTLTVRPNQKRVPDGKSHKIFTNFAIYLTMLQAVHASISFVEGKHRKINVCTKPMWNSIFEAPISAANQFELKLKSPNISSWSSKFMQVLNVLLLSSGSWNKCTALLHTSNTKNSSCDETS